MSGLTEGYSLITYLHHGTGPTLRFLTSCHRNSVPSFLDVGPVVQFTVHIRFSVFLNEMTAYKVKCFGIKRRPRNPVRILFWKFQWGWAGVLAWHLHAFAPSSTSGERVRSQFETIGLARTQQPLILCQKRDSDWSAPWHFTVLLHTWLADETWQGHFIDWNRSATAELAQEQGWISLRTCAVFHRDHRVYLHLHRRDGLWGCGGRRAMALSSEYEWLGGGRHRFDSWHQSVLYELRWLCSLDVFFLTLFHIIPSSLSFLSHAHKNELRNPSLLLLFCRYLGTLHDWGEILSER